jgi:Ca2+-binding RTX toxin-like protein
VTVVVTPIADDFLILAKDLTLNSTGLAPLELNVPLESDDENDDSDDSNKKEVSIVASLGGSILDNSNGEWIFSGTEDQTNTLQLVSGPLTAAIVTTVNLSGITRDGKSELATPITDFFRLTVAKPKTAGVTRSENNVSGGAGNDVLTGVAGRNSTLSGGAGRDLLIRSSGADVMTGGTGSDVFRWSSDDLFSGVDIFTDFTSSIGGDQLHFSSLLTGFNPQLSKLSDFFKLVEGISDTTVRVDINGLVGGLLFSEIVVLQGLTGLDLDQLWKDGNLVL